MSYTIALFDFDGTICDTEPSIYFSLTEVSKRFCDEPPGQVLIQGISTGGLPLQESLKQLIPGASDSTINSAVDYYRDVYREHGNLKEQLFSGVRETLESFKSKGITSLIVSNKVNQLIELSLERFSLTEFFSGIYGIVPGRKAKPDSEVYLNFVKRDFPHTSAQVIYIGDTVIDQTFAANCGIDLCFASYGYGRLNDELPCKYKVATFTELREII